MQGIESLDNFKNFVSSIGGLGRYEDTYIVHAAEGETVVPMEVLDSNPVLKERLFESMRDMGIEPERYIVGNELNSINPITGQPEFFLKKIGRRLRKAIRDIGSRARKAAADVSGYAAPIAGAFFGAPAGALVGGLLGQYKRENPGDPNQALQMALRGGIAGLGANLLTGQSPFTLGGGLRGALQRELGKSAVGFNPLEMLGQAKNLGLSKLFTTEGGTGLGRFRLFDNFNFSDLLQQANLDSESTVEEEVRKGGGKIISALFGGKALPLILAAYGTKKLGDAIKEEQEQARRDEEEAKRKFNENLSTGQYEALLADVQGVNLPPSFAAQGGVMDLRQGGESEGPGTGTSDDIPAMLSDGEFVMTAKAVRGAGGGDRREGAKRMYQMMDNLEARA
jgi:hypothetical protein